MKGRDPRAVCGPPGGAVCLDISTSTPQWVKLFAIKSWCDMRLHRIDQCVVLTMYHVREEGGGMFIEADDSLSQLVSPQTIRERPQLPLHLRP